MAHTMPYICPACAEKLRVTELTCPSCNTRIQGDFQAPGLSRLSAEQLQFVETFVRCRGNIREVEKEVRLSYPAVRSRLDQVIAAMGYPVSSTDMEERPIDALDALANGDITFDEALAWIKGEKRK